MSVSPEEVTKVASLASLTIPEKELPEVTDRFARVLDLVDELNNIETSGILPMSNPHDMEQRLRTDEVTTSNQRELLMASAPTSEGGYFLVPKVID